MNEPRRGRRSPELLTPLPAVAEVTPEEDHTEAGELLYDGPLLFEGDLVTSSCTLAVILPGDARESFIGYKVTSRVQDGETAADVYARVVTVVNEGVISQIDDVIDRLNEYNAELAKRGVIPGQVPHA